LASRTDGWLTAKQVEVECSAKSGCCMIELMLSSLAASCAPLFAVRYLLYLSIYFFPPQNGLFFTH
jgi:hypothetical protein